MTDDQVVALLRTSRKPVLLEAADRIERLKKALGFMLESYGMSIGELCCSRTPLSSQAVRHLKKLFDNAAWCNDVFHEA